MLEAATLLKTRPRPPSHFSGSWSGDSNLLADEDTGRAELEDVTNVEEDEDVTMSRDWDAAKWSVTRHLLLRCHAASSSSAPRFATRKIARKRLQIIFGKNIYCHMSSELSGV